MFTEQYMTLGGAKGVYVARWTPEGEPRAVVQIVHGMAERISRYGEFASFLTENGVAVVGCDLPGHGDTLKDGDVPGFFRDEKGWDLCVDVIHALHGAIKIEYPGIPTILLGHSMGSFLARTYAARFNDEMDAYIFSGTAGKNGAIPIAKLIAKFAIWRGKLKVANTMLDGLSFGAYNKPFRPERTKFDWLSKNDESVDAYVADPLCGFPFTTGGFRDLFDGLTEISAKEWPARVPKKPILMISGEDDPVGGKNLKGVYQVAKALKETGHEVELKVYKGCRHEVLNEVEREAVFADVLRFVLAVSC